MSKTTELLLAIDSFLRQCSPHHRERDWHRLLTTCRVILATQELKLEAVAALSKKRRGEG